MRRATIVIFFKRDAPSQFLSTLSLRRATNANLRRHSSNNHFYPRSPCGERRLPTALRTPHQRFLSTLSLRRATRIPAFLPADRIFLSTLSLRRATINPANQTNLPGYFYPRSPCGERHQRHLPDSTHRRISIHALLAESDHIFRNFLYRRLNFYPRSPCGERPAFDVLAVSALPFLSTLSLRRATDVIAVMTDAQSISIHALLAESDSPPSITPAASRNFYPRSPCGERHAADISQIREPRISIHALLAESDQAANGLADAPPQISIHALLAESDAVMDNIVFMPREFLSTLSLRRAT